MFEPNRDDTQYVLNISYGKDSLACLGACKLLGWRIDRIIHAEVWATDTIPADLPPMTEFKKKADKIIKEHFGITVEHVYATIGSEKMTYEKMFYHTRTKGYRKGEIAGFPFHGAPECNAALKRPALQKAESITEESKTVSFVGIAADEKDRLLRLDNERKVSPLAAIGWTEADCMKWCVENDLRSPLYDDMSRGGCWFCHNQTVEQLRQLRHKYPDLWKIFLKWDKDSPVTFKSNGLTLHDYDNRFELEDKNMIPVDKRFRWNKLKELIKELIKHE